MKSKVLIFILTFFYISISGQIKFYTYSQETIQPSDYNLITNGFVLGSNSSIYSNFHNPSEPQGSPLPFGPGFPIGFDFAFNNDVYNRFGVNSGGSIYLGKSVYGDSAVINLYNNIIPDRSNLISIFGGAVRKDSSQLSFKVEGSQPNRKLIIQWKYFKVQNTNSNNTSGLNFQIHLLEGSNQIEFHYGPNGWFNTNFIFYPNFLNVGLTGRSLKDINVRDNYWGQGSSGPLYNWNFTTKSTKKYYGCFVTYTQNYTEGPYYLVMKWAPPACPPPVYYTMKNLTSSSANISWEHVNSAYEGYQYFVSTDSMPSTFNVTKTIGDSASITNLLPSQKYYFHVRSRCEDTTYSEFYVYPFYTPCEVVDLPYYHDFEEEVVGELPACFISPFEYEDTYQWATGNGFFPDNKSVVHNVGNSSWVFSPSFHLEKDSAYSILYENLGLNYKLYVGSFPTPAGMQYLDSLYSNNGPLRVKRIFTPDSTGTYTFGIKSFQPPGAFEFDNFNIYKGYCDTVTSFEILDNGGNTMDIKVHGLNPSDSLQFKTLFWYQDYMFSDYDISRGDTLHLENLNYSESYKLFLRNQCAIDVHSLWKEFQFITKPPNDECSSAKEIIPSDNMYANTYYEKLLGSTPSSPPISNCTSINQRDIWYKFTATNRSHNIALSTPYDESADTSQAFLLEVYNTNCSNLEYCNSNVKGIFEYIKSDCEIGNTYLIRMMPLPSIIIPNFNPSIGVGTIKNENIECSFSQEIFASSIYQYPTESNLASTNFSNETNQPTCASGNINYSLWYNFTVADTAYYIDVKFSSLANPVVQIFSSSCGSLVQTHCVDERTDSTEFIHLQNLTIGDNFKIRIFDKDNDSSDIKTWLYLLKPAPNDECSDAEEVFYLEGNTLQYPVIGNTSNAFGQDSCDAHYADDDVWYKFQAVDTFHYISVRGKHGVQTMINPVIEFYGDNCTNQSIKCEDAENMRVSNLIPGQLYYYKVYSSSHESGKGEFEMSITSPVYYVDCSSPKTILVSDTFSCNNILEVNNIGAPLPNEIWLSFTANSTSHHVEISSFSSIYVDTVDLYTSCTGVPLPKHEVDQKNVYFKNLTIGSTYLLRLKSAVSLNTYWQSNFFVCVSPSALNDECENAKLLIPGLFNENNINSTTRNSTLSDSEDCFVEQSDVWFKFIAKKTYHRAMITPQGNGSYAEAALFKGSCSGTSIYCTNHEIENTNTTSAFLSNLDVDSTYYLRVKCENEINSFDGVSDFNIFIDSSPENDECVKAIIIEPTFATDCPESIIGTTVGATGGVTVHQGKRSNVWYKLQSDLDFPVTAKVRSLTPGFDPALRIRQEYLGNTYGNNACVNIVHYHDANLLDLTHNNYSTEVIPLGDISPDSIRSFGGNATGGMTPTYYLEIIDGPKSQNQGEFEICLSYSKNNMEFTAVDYETYMMDTTKYDLGTLLPDPAYRDVKAGTWQQAICRVTFYYTGYKNPPTLNKFIFNTQGTTNRAYIKNAKLFSEDLDPSSLGVYENFHHPFDFFGKPYKVQLGLTETPSRQFGKTIENIDSIMVFEDNMSIIPATYQPYGYRNFYLTYDVLCDVPTNNYINAKCLEIEIEGEKVIPYEKFSQPKLIVPQTKYETTNHGLWHDPNTWVCGEVPPDSMDIYVLLNHDLVMQDTNVIGNIKVNYSSSLDMKPQSSLTLGHHSMGSFHGHSNKYFDCQYGSLSMDRAFLEVNGGFQFGYPASSTQGDGICCNNGTGFYKLSGEGNIYAQGSAFESSESTKFYVAISNDNSTTQNAINKENRNNKFKLFETVREQEPTHSDSGNRDFKDVFEFKVNKEALQYINESKLEKIYVSIPISESKWEEVELNKVDLFSPNFRLSSSTNANISKPNVSTYILENSNYSIKNIVLNTFENEVFLSVSDREGNLTVSQKDVHETYTLRNEDKDHLNSIICHTEDQGYKDEEVNNLDHNRRIQNSTNNKVVQLYIEVDKDVYDRSGSVASTFNYITNLYSQVKALYLAVSINIVISEIKIWVESSPYTGNDALSLLTQFSNRINEYNGDLAQLVSYRALGGYAFVDALCENDVSKTCAYVGIEPNFASYPSYSFSVLVAAHELGHQLGSPHTHACFWNGNKTSIDGCYPPEGTCSPGPIPINGGTIMSYCHLSSVGINFNNGLGTQPKNLILNKIANSECLATLDELSNHNLVLEILTDNKPEETNWNITTPEGVEVYTGGNYTKRLSLTKRYLSLPSGYFIFNINDITKPQNHLIVNNSTITIDPNDGVDTTWRQQGFNFYTDMAAFYKSKIHILDPPDHGPSVVNINTPIPNYYNTIPRPFIDCTLQFGGGDDTNPNHPNFSLYHLTDQEWALFIVTSWDSLIIDDYIKPIGQKRKLIHEARTGNYFKNVLIKPGNESIGTFFVGKSLHNDGIITIGDDKILGFKSLTDTINWTGNGFYKSKMSDPNPTMPQQNKITNVLFEVPKSIIVSSTFQVTDALRLKAGNVFVAPNKLITHGIPGKNGIIRAEPFDPQLDINYEDIGFTGDINDWDGGMIVGPIKRYIDTFPNNSCFFPVGGNNGLHPIDLRFNNVAKGDITVEYTASDPGSAGLPILEQNKAIGMASPSGYWKVSSELNQPFTVCVNAEGFKDHDNVLLANNIQDVRIIKRPTDSLWISSSSTSTTGPSMMKKIEAQNMVGFSDFGIGKGNDCSLVTTSQDSIPGSLRFVLDCIPSGDTIRFDKNLTDVYVEDDTLIIDKAVNIVGKAINDIKIHSVNNYPLFKVNQGKEVLFKNLTFMPNPNVNFGSAIINNGYCTLNNVEIIDSFSSGHSTIVNKGSLNVEGLTKIRD